MEEQVQEKKRPTFLTVLGILSFIGVAWQIIGGVMQMAAGAVTSKFSDAAGDLAESTKSMEGFENLEGMEEVGGQMDSALDSAAAMAQHASTLGIISIVAAIVCLIGVIMMWKLKKSGFFIYVIGEIAAPVATMILVGFGFGGFMAIAGMIVPIIMIILYGLNLKHMS